MLAIVTRNLTLDITGILRLPQKGTISTSILLKKPHKWNFAIKTNFARNETLCRFLYLYNSFTREIYLEV